MGLLLQALRRVATREQAASAAHAPSGAGDLPWPVGEQRPGFDEPAVPAVATARCRHEGPGAHSAAPSATAVLRPPRITVADAGPKAGGEPLEPLHRPSANLVCFYEPQGPIAAQYRLLASNLLRHANRHGLQSFCFAGPGRRDGKTTTLLNVALMLARGGHSVGVVEAQLSRPAVAALLGVQAERGLAEILRGDAALDEVLVRRRGAPASTEAAAEIGIVPAGRVRRRTAPVLSAEAITAVLVELRRRYRVVLVDTPGLAHRPSLAALCALCDGTYLVVRLGQTVRRDAETARRALEHVGTRLLGSVVTGRALPAGGPGYPSL